MSNKPIKYVESLLPMGTELPVKRLIKNKGIIAKRGNPIEPSLKITVPEQLDFMKKALARVQISNTAKVLEVPRDMGKTTGKYDINID